MVDGNALAALVIIFAASVAGDEVCPLGADEHAQILMRYREVCETLGAKTKFPGFDPYVQQPRLAPEPARRLGRVPSLLGWNPLRQRRNPREPTISRHGVRGEFRSALPEYSHTIAGPIRALVAARSLAVVYYQNEALESYLEYKYDRYLAGKGPPPTRGLSPAEAQDRCREYLRILFRTEFDDLVGLEGPFYDEPEPNYSTSSTNCDRTKRCWPRWVVKLWRVANGVVSANHVAMCAFDAVWGPTIISTNSGLYETPRGESPRLIEAEANEIAQRVVGRLGRFVQLDARVFGTPVFRSSRLVFAMPRTSLPALEQLVDAGDIVPGGPRFRRYEGTPLAWEVSFEVDGNHLPNGVALGLFHILVYVDAGSGHLLNFDFRKIR